MFKLSICRHAFNYCYTVFIGPCLPSWHAPYTRGSPCIFDVLVNCLDLAQLIVCLVVQMELLSWNAFHCRQLTLRWNRDREKQPSSEQFYFKIILVLSLHCTFQRLIFSGLREQAYLKSFLRKHTHIQQLPYASGLCPSRHNHIGFYKVSALKHQILCALSMMSWI